MGECQNALQQGGVGEINDDIRLRVGLEELLARRGAGETEAVAGTDFLCQQPTDRAGRATQ